MDSPGISVYSDDMSLVTKLYQVQISFSPPESGVLRVNWQGPTSRMNVHHPRALPRGWGQCRGVRWMMIER